MNVIFRLGPAALVGALSVGFIASRHSARPKAVVSMTLPVSTQPDTSPVSLPKLLVTTRPTPVRTVNVAASGNLQSALDAAKGGDRIVVPCGAKYSSITLKGSVGPQWRELASACALPNEGSRVSPSTSLASIVASGKRAAISVAPGATRWRVTGLEVTNDQTVAAADNLIDVGDGSANTNEKVPRNIVFDRLYIHSWPKQDIHRCISANGDSLALIDSYVSECHSERFDSQAIWWWNANGPTKIVNNYLEASTEVLGAGGADPGIDNLVPSDIEIRGNHITRPMAWKAAKWLEKNLIEFKSGRRILIDGNVLENAWPQAQLGWAFVLWSVNQNGRCTWCVVTDVTIQRNLVRNVAAGFQLTDKYSTPSIPMQRLVIRNNVFTGLADPSVGSGGYGFLVQNIIPSLTIEHNTLINPSAPSWMWPGGTFPLPNHIVRNNITGGCSPNQYQVSMQMAWSKLTVPPSTFTNNVIACYDNYQNYLPAGNFFPKSIAAIGFANDGMSLAATSPFKGRGTDGKDIGADVAAVKAATANVVQPAAPDRATRP